MFCSQIYTLKLDLRPKNWLDLSNFNSSDILEFLFKKIFLLFLDEFELLIFHNNIVKMLEKNEQA